MKCFYKLLGIAALAAVIAIGLAGCRNLNSGGAVGTILTIKNNTPYRFIGITIEDSWIGTDNIGYIVGSYEEEEPIDIGPGGTYTSPEINCSYINCSVYLDDGEIVTWGGADNCEWEAYVDTEHGNKISLRNISDKRFPGAH
jgi:hypothetical protein